MEHDPATLTDSQVLARVRAHRMAAHEAEVEILLLAAAWADAHPASDDDPEPYAAGDTIPSNVDEARVPVPGIPAVAWDAPAVFAAANGITTHAGRLLIRDALVLRHRLPNLWARLQTPAEHPLGVVPVWRARRIAARLAGESDPVVADLDAQLTPVAHKVGAVTIDRLLDEAMLRHHPAERERAQLAALEAMGVRLADQVTPDFVGHMDIDADYADLHDLDHTLSDLAQALVHHGHAHLPLEVRRAVAVGVLADPARAAAILAGVPAADLPAPRRQRLLVLHLNPDHNIGRVENTNTPVSADMIRAWCSREDTNLKVLPVIDLNAPAHVQSYEIPDRLKTQVQIAAVTCGFPFCNRPARGCDTDHRQPHDQGGETSNTNLVPLCRHHHRLKTHAGWTYTTIEPGVHLWRSPYGEQYLRDPTGTTDITPIPARE